MKNNMAPQFTRDQRNFLVMEYHKRNPPNSYDYESKDGYQSASLEVLTPEEATSSASLYYL